MGGWGGEGESEKLKKGVVQEPGVFKKGGGRGLALSLFNLFKRLIIFTFRNYFYPLQNCVTYAFEEKKFFSAAIKVILRSLKTNLKISQILR